MMKILNIISDSNIGGAGRTILNYLKYADKSRFYVYTVVPRGSLLIDQLKELNANIIEIDGLAERSFNIGDISKLKKLISEIHPDLVHTHGALSGRIAAKQCDCKVVYTKHSAFPVPEKYKVPPYKWVIKYINEHYSDHMIAIGPSAKENLMETGVSENDITTIFNGVAPLKKIGPKDAADLRREYGIANDEFVMVLLARIEEYKGHAVVVEAAKELKAAARRFKIIFAGKGSYEAELKQQIEDAGLSENFIFTGYTNKVEELLGISDVQLNASYFSETSSLSILEGFSIGLPAVVSACGGNPFLVENGINGIVFENKNSEALCNAILKLMDNPQLLSGMKPQAEKIYKERFSGEIFAKNIEEVYIKTIKGAW